MYFCHLFECYESSKHNFLDAHLVRPKSEELISRPFVGEIQFQLVLLKRMGTESAIGCLIFYPPGTFFLPHTCTQHPRGHGRFQKDLFRSRSIGFVWWEIHSTCFWTNPSGNAHVLADAVCMCGAKQKYLVDEKKKQPIADSLPMRFCSTNWNWVSPTNGREISSSLFGLTRFGQL